MRVIDRVIIQHILVPVAQKAHERQRKRHVVTLRVFQEHEAVNEKAVDKCGLIGFDHTVVDRKAQPHGFAFAGRNGYFAVINAFEGCHSDLVGPERFARDKIVITAADLAVIVHQHRFGKIIGQRPVGTVMDAKCQSQHPTVQFTELDLRTGNAVDLREVRRGGQRTFQIDEAGALPPRRIDRICAGRSENRCRTHQQRIDIFADFIFVHFSELFPDILFHKRSRACVKRRGHRGAAHVAVGVFIEGGIDV